MKGARVAAIAAALVVGACTSGVDGADESGGSQTASVGRGGTLRLAQVGDVDAGFDPNKSYYSVTWGYYRCCLIRTLMSYNGRATEDGGAELQPDIASGPPHVSPDGLTYTFTVKSGIFYSPPFDDVEVTTADFIRALEREADPDASAGGYSFYYSVIEGFDEFRGGDADTIAGLEAPDDATLIVRLSEPAGELPYLFALSATAPIPPDAPDERLGAAEGHTKNYGRFLVATGPYMFLGSEELDFSLPADEQTPVAGYRPGSSIQLVRNPSYDPSTDGLRPAYPDAIEVTIGGDNTDLHNKVEAGDIDIVVDNTPPAPTLRRYSSDPALEPFLHIDQADALLYLEFNLAEPPFDDVHVRRAVNLALDKSGMRLLRGGASTGEIAGHVMPDSLTAGLLADYDPYATADQAGDIEAAKNEMSRSAYDSDSDGVCDHLACDGALAVTDESDPYPLQAALIQDDLEPLGITLDVKTFETTTMYAKCGDPSSHMAMCLATGWGKDFPDAYTFGPPLFGSDAIFPSCCNDTLTGASPKLLTDYGYEVSGVPSVDDRMVGCRALVGEERTACWAEVDRYLMEEVVPVVPYLFESTVRITSSRIVNYSFDQFSGMPALDQLAIAPEQQ